MTEKETKMKEQESDNSKIFPQKLMEILEDPSNNDAIAWHPNGKVFIIVDRRKFCKYVLPKYFRKSKYTSFTRKLNRWNFTRLTRGRQVSTYYHEFFQRDKSSLCTQMYCNNDRAKFAVSSKTDDSDTAKEGKEASARKPNLANIHDQVLPFEHQHSSAEIAKSVEADLKARSALMKYQNSLIPNGLTPQCLIPNSLMNVAIAGKPISCTQPSLPGCSSGALLHQHALLRKQQVLEQEAARLRLQLSMMQQQRLPNAKTGSNFCSAA